MVVSNQAAGVVEFRTVTMIRIAAAISVCLALFFARRLAANNPPKFSDSTGMTQSGGCDLGDPALTAAAPGSLKTDNDNFSDMPTRGLAATPSQTPARLTPCAV